MRVDNGVDPNWPWIVDRTSLVKKVHEALTDGPDCVMLLTSPPSTGKTSLFSLYSVYLSKDAHNFQCVYYSALELLPKLDQHGMFFTKEFFEKSRADAGNRKVVYLVDDAQLLYGIEAFWGGLNKDHGLYKNHIAGKHYFFFGVTYTVSIGRTPVNLADFVRFTVDDLLVDDDTAKEYLTRLSDAFELVLPVSGSFVSTLKHSAVMYLIVANCGGSLGVLFKSVFLLAGKYGKRVDKIEVQQMIHYYLSRECSRGFERCFVLDNLPTAASNPRIVAILRRIATEGKVRVTISDPDIEDWRELISAGLVKVFNEPKSDQASSSSMTRIQLSISESVKSYHFVSPIARQ